jgi:hypothetical protein
VRPAQPPHLQADQERVKAAQEGDSGHLNQCRAEAMPFDPLNPPRSPPRQSRPSSSMPSAVPFSRAFHGIYICAPLRPTTTRLCARRPPSGCTSTTLAPCTWAARGKGNGRLVRHPRRQEVSGVLAYLLRWEPVGKTTCLLTLLMDHGVE